jgi:hypothetical protein
VLEELTIGVLPVGQTMFSVPSDSSSQVSVPADVVN